MKRQPIVEGSKFKAKSGEVWTVTECLGFGRGYWVLSADRCRQTIMNRYNLELMERVEDTRTPAQKWPGGVGSTNYI